MNHVTGETYWDTEAGNSGMAMNEKDCKETRNTRNRKN